MCSKENRHSKSDAKLMLRDNIRSEPSTRHKYNTNKMTTMVDLTDDVAAAIDAAAHEMDLEDVDSENEDEPQEQLDPRMNF